MKLTGAQILCEALLKEGVEVIFGLPGGSVLPLYDTLLRYPRLRHILVRHEQGAAHAADGYARATGKVGVCLATSGPGATNLVTGIAAAYLDSSPMIAITGQVARPFLGKDSFQEIDITGITLPITKHNYLVMEVEDLAQTVKEAFYIARSGRPGPVLLDIPRDIFVAEANFSYPEKMEMAGYKPTLSGHPSQIKKAAQLIDTAQRPLIIAGQGVNISKAHAELKELVEKCQIPVTTTFLGIDAFPQNHFLNLGMLGMHGLACANESVNAADVIIALGMRFDDRATGRVNSFAPEAKIIHVDIDPAEIGKNVPVEVPIVGDLRRVLQAINEEVKPQTHLEWMKQVERWRHEHPHSVPEVDGLLPQFVIRQIYEATHGEAIIVTGVGQHQMWAAQYFCFTKPRSLVSSGGLGTMGFEVPAALGAKIGRPQETVWCIAGDGSIQMTIQELATLVQEKAAVKIAIMNNGYLGMVRQWQELFYSRRYSATHLSNPDFVKIAEGYGVAGMRVTQKNQVLPAVLKAMEHPGPFLIDFLVEPEENVYPIVPPGASLAEFMESPAREKVSPASTLKVSNV
ncbi:MAG: biosynthetic-type acetolactate synthase large subunit [Chloroflexota bacterium]